MTGATSSPFDPVALQDADVAAARRRRSLRVVVGALSALVLTVAVLGTWQVLAARSSQRDQILQGELTAAQLAGKTVASAVASREQLLEDLAGQPEASTLASVSEATSLQPILGEVARLYPQFSSISVLDDTGRLVARSPVWPATASVRAATTQSFEAVLRSGQSSVGEAFEQPSGALAVTVAAPVRGASDALVGLLEATLPVSSISDALGGSRLGGGGSLVLVDKAGHVMSGPAAGAGAGVGAGAAGAPGSASDARPAKNTGLPASAVTTRALHGASGTATAPVPGYSGDRLVAYAPVRSIGWAVIVERSQSALGGPVDALTERLAGIGAAVVFFAIVTALVLWLLLRQLSRQRDEVAAIFASVGEGVATVDASGRVVRVNPALGELCGQRPSAFQNRPWWDAFALYDDRGTAIAWEDTVVAEAISTRSVVASRGFSQSLQRADGRRLPVAVTAAPLYVNRSSPTGAVVVMRDVSSEREVDQLKSSLVSTVSHELRTPLTLIQGFSELLLTRSNLDSVQAQSALLQVHGSSQRLGRLIDDLLSVSRIESGRLSLETTPVDLAGVVKEVTSSFAPQSEHRFTTSIPDGLPSVVADRDKVLQILTNLVSNAVKYSAAGSEVRITAREAGNHVEVDVVDHGIGLNAPETAGVFEKFTRSDRPEVRKVGGTGLGLYITKNLVELQGGQVWMHSQPGSGSTFTFTLPLDRVTAAEEAPCEHC